MKKELHEINKTTFHNLQTIYEIIFSIGESKLDFTDLVKHIEITFPFLTKKETTLLALRVLLVIRDLSVTKFIK